MKMKSRFLSWKGHDVSTRDDEKGFGIQACHVRNVSICCVPGYPDSGHRSAMHSNAAKKPGIRFLFGGLAAFTFLLLLGGEAFASYTGSNRI